MAATHEPEAATNISALSDEAVVAAPEVADVPPEIADAHDEAVLDMIAFEMAASDPWDADDAAYADPADADGDILIAEPPPAEPQTTARAPEPAAMPAMAPVVQPSLEPSLSRPSFERPVEPSPGP